MHSQTLWTTIDFGGSIAIFSVLCAIWWFHFRREPRRVWRCIRYQGGGLMMSPRPMNTEEVTRWLGSLNAEVSHIDHDFGFVFYRPRGA